MPTPINKLTPQQHAQQEINHLNSKPRLFTQQQTTQLSALYQEIKALVVKVTDTNKAELIQQALTKCWNKPS